MVLGITLGLVTFAANYSNPFGHPGLQPDLGQPKVPEVGSGVSEAPAPLPRSTGWRENWSVLQNHTEFEAFRPWFPG